MELYQILIPRYGVTSRHILHLFLSLTTIAIVVIMSSAAQNLASKLLILTVILLLPVKVSAFGAGDIPDFAYLNGSLLR